MAKQQDVFKLILDKAKCSGKKIVLPEGSDERIINAAKQATKLDICHVILLGNVNLLSEYFTKKELKNITIFNPENDGHRREIYANTYYELRKHKGMTPEQALEDMKDHNKFAMMMLYTGDADGVCSGAVTETAEVLRPAFQIIKAKPGIGKVSSSFIMEVPKGMPYGENGMIVFSDCGVIENPTDQDICDIANLASGISKDICGNKPRVALLSFTTKTDENNPNEGVQKMKRAYKLIRRSNPSLTVDGELQGDAALVPTVAKLKCPNSVVEGRANVLVFPDLMAGNIGYKLVQRFGGVRAIGPILQGLNKPVNDISRGATSEEIVLNMAITVLQSKQ